MVVRSKLKRKVVAWLVSMGRLATFDPKLYNESVEKAIHIYESQIRAPHPMFYKGETTDSR